MAERDLSDYVEVSERIADFRKKYPDGTLQPYTRGEPFRLIQAQGFEKNGDVINQTFIVVVAAAYRDRDDPNPGVGMAWEIFPGRTPYTRGSELQNAETSAWGRAIIAVGASDSKRGIASREEVRNRQAEREPSWPCGNCKHDRESHITRIGGPLNEYQAHGCRECDCRGYEPLPRNADGSLSRSRMTDEQKAAAGVMTDAEQRAHNALAKPPPNSGKVERIGPGQFVATVDSGGSAVDDRWTSDAPSWLVGVDPPEDQPGSILPAQIKQIHAVYAALKINGDGRHIDAAKVLAIKVASFNDLSYQQAARLLENLHERHTGKMTRR